MEQSLNPQLLKLREREVFKELTPDIVKLYKEIETLRGNLGKFIGGHKALNKIIKVQRNPKDKSSHGFKGKKVVHNEEILCGIHNFFEDPKLMVLELVREFWRTAKVYRNEDIGGYFGGKVPGIQVKLTAEMIVQAIGYERHRTKFMNNWENELKNHIGYSMWGPN
ncbi:hypothetical protein JHK84_034300 [Glycine max]|nr:hypothetical protein JHK84_034300 [Glycine max]